MVTRLETRRTIVMHYFSLNQRSNGTGRFVSRQPQLWYEFDRTTHIRVYHSLAIKITTLAKRKKEEKKTTTNTWMSF